MIKVYAFDFDGVISDSAKGWAFFCREAWIRMGNRPIPLKKIEKYRPYVKNAEESFGLLVLLSKKSKITRENIKEATSQKEKVREFVRLFLKEKSSIDKNKLARLYGPYKFILSFLKNIRKPIYIVTNTKKEYILPTLKMYNLPINDDSILDVSLSHDKKKHIAEICRREKITPEDIVFVEDSIDHLKDVIPTKMQAYLASWGCVLKEDIKEAQILGIRVLNKENISSILHDVEYFDVVNEKDKVIGKASRDECHKKGLLHRASHILILNSEGKILFQKRSMEKDLYPGWWIDSAAGHLDSGEGYETAAHRELKEELGIDTNLVYLFLKRKQWKGKGKIDNEIVKVFGGKHSGPFNIEKSEVDFVKFLSLKEVLSLMKTDKVTPLTVEILKELKKNPTILKRLNLL